MNAHIQQTFELTDNQYDELAPVRRCAPDHEVSMVLADWFPVSGYEMHVMVIPEELSFAFMVLVNPRRALEKFKIGHVPIDVVLGAKRILESAVIP